MTVSVRRSPTRRAIPLGLSALAFAGLAYLEGVPAHAGEGEPAAILEVQAWPAPEPTRIVLADVRAQTRATRSVQRESVQAQATLPASMVTLPGVVGLDVREARKILRARGLKVTVRDQFNERIDRADMRFYDVERQSVQEGEKVAPGTWVRLTAEDNFPVTMGY